MEHKYLVGEFEREFGEECFRIVVASSPEEAATKFARHVLIQDEMFLDHVYDQAVNMSFAEHFYLQTAEEKERFSRTGEVELSEEEFERRVRKFFAGRSDFADLYLAFYSSDDEEDEPSFPEEMLLYIWHTSDWSNLAVLDIADIESF